MILTVVFNAILAVGVITMVVTPLVWATLTQHRDHPRAATTAATMRAPQSHERRQAARSQYKPLVGRI